MPLNFKQRWTKRILGALSGVVLMAYVLAFSVGPVAAQGLPVIDAKAEADRRVKDVELTIGEALLTAALQSVMNTAQFFIRKISYDTAVYLASGGKGQGSLIEQQGWDKYIESVALDTAAEAIHQIGEPYGLNLCEMPDIKLQAFIQIGLRDLYTTAPQPNCSWQQLKKGWSEETFLEKYGPGFEKLIPEKFSDVVSVKRSDFGVSLDAIAQVDRFTAGKEQAKALERLTNKGIKSVEDLISGQIITPAPLLEEEVRGLSAREDGTRSNVAIAGIYGSEALSLIPYAAQVFLSTYASQLLQRVFSDGIVPPGSQYSPNAFGIFRSNRSVARNALTDFLGATVRDVPEYDIVTRFSACPRNPKLDNCVMDTDLARAVARGSIAGEALTIREAINEGLLHGDWPLISPRREVDNTKMDCYKRAYCYSNIQKMRKARILPLGFEIAAFKADPSNPSNWTLEKVVNNFNNCTPPNDQYCHLIDPNWVIKAPIASCPSEAYGPNLVTGRSPNRSQECVDLATCVATDSDGKCLSQGFCTKEKNVWRFVADQCKAQYATCRTYETGSGEASYLSRTLDFGRCSADNVGCRTYSIDQTSSSKWLASNQVSIALKTQVPGRNQILHLNGTINNHSCSSGDDGCSVFYSAARDINEQVVRNAAGEFIQDKTQPVAYLKKAPDYLGCYDADRSDPDIDWPTTLTQVQTDVSQDARCKDDYAGVCIASEVGCESYTQPNDPTAPAIPGIVGANGCSLACLGYDTYKQLHTNFETSTFPLYFAPQYGQRCESDYAGCDEFTNLDESSAGGEQLEYYTSIKYCEKPSATNQKAFYSWEGSDDEGFELKVHNLRPMAAADTTYIVGTSPNLTYLAGTPANLAVSVTAATVFRPGSPAYADDSRTATEENFRVCNEAAYLLRIQDPSTSTAASPDCRALYDDNGDVFYRLLEDTVTISNACRRLRKTNAELYVDRTLASQAACNTKAGYWAPTTPGGADVCQRCYSGGSYANGTCVYNAIPGASESRACPASANLCRHYVGNTGRDINTSVVADEFEGSTASSSWGIGRDGSGTNPANLRVAAEAIVVGGNSLRIDAPAVARQIASSSLSYGASYELTFWARGATQNLTISFGQNGTPSIPLTIDPDTGATRNISIGNTWRQYRVGPAELNLDFTQSNTIELIFERVGGGTGAYFIDHVRLTQLQDQIFLIKDSWKRDYNNDGQVTDAPNLCDANPTDSFPGAALGCREYQDSRNRPVYATGFEQLCREEAVGCEPLWDTYNTFSPRIGDVDETRMHAYNLACFGTAGQTCKISVRFDPTRLDEYKCQVGARDTHCVIPQKVVIPDAPFQFPQDVGGPNRAGVVTSTIIIPADTPTSTPVFLAAGMEGKHRCKKEGLGCIRAGREEQVLPDPSDPNAYQFVAQFIKNDPALYTVDTGQGIAAGTLCQEDVVGCDSFKSGQDTIYFKDPKITGQSLCRYQEGVTLPNGTTINGWFYDNLGQCANGDLCRTDNDCGGVTSACTQKNIVPCYPGFVRRSTLQGLVYDLYSNDSQAYRGHVGVCPRDQHLCTEFVDPTDITNQYPNGRPYYVKKNERIKEKERACEAGVSRTEGCILFNETSNPSRPYHSTSTYQSSAQASPPFRQVPAIGSPVVGKNDSNIVLKVDRDRECAEWLSCRSAIVQIDKDGSKSELCYDYRACSAINPDGSCANWVGQNELSLLPLTETRYTQRAVGWNDPEYSGYTVFNKRQINDYQYISFDLSVYMDAQSDPNAKAAIKRLADTQYLVFPFTNADADCDNNGTPKDSFVSCAPNEQGRCVAGKCYVPTEGRFPPYADITTSSIAADPVNNLKALLDNLVSGSCKAYPEQDSPFPQTILSEAVTDQDFTPNTSDDPVGNVKKADLSVTAVSPNKPYRTEFGIKKQGFERANVCQDGVDCSCKYNKVVYTNGPTDYWTIDNRALGVQIGKGVCVGGPNAGRPCSRASGSSNCGTGGTCQFIEKKETHVGLSGFCLERDYSRPINGKSLGGSAEQEFACLTWLPIEVSASTLDVFNTHIAAGYQPDIDAPGSLASGPYGKLYCTNATKVGDGIYTVRGWGTANPPTQSLVGSMTGQFFTPNAPDSNRGFFLPGGGPRLGDARRDCVSQSFTRTLGNGTTTTVSVRGISLDFPYQSLVCDPTFGYRNTYQVMKIWGWNVLGRNAELLRFEKKPDGITNLDVSDQRYSGASNVTCSGNCDNIVSFSTSHFTPRVTKGDRGTLGTVMHPPRLFNEDKNDPNYQTPPANSDRYNRPDRSGETMSAQNFRAGGHTEDEVSPDRSSVYVFPAEVQVREADISRVYFVPTHYPDGNEGAMPQLLTESLYIDFLNLKSKPTRAEVGAVEAIFDDDAVWPDGNYVSDPISYSGNIGDASYPIPGDSSKRWTYLLERDRQAGQVSDVDTVGFTSAANPGNRSQVRSDYPYDFGEAHGGVYNSWWQTMSPSLRKRNEIARRYVLVWVTDIVGNEKKNFPSFVPKVAGGGTGSNTIEETPPKTISQDPFEASFDCASGGPQHENWFAIGMDFNADGEFLGYISRWCNNTPVDGDHDDNAVAFAVFATLKDHCTEMVQVYDDSAIGVSGAETNKAWTNRVWWHGADTHPGSGFSLTKSQHNVPFGSLNLDSSEIFDRQLVRNTTFRYPSDVVNGSTVLQAADGVPYACTQSDWPGYFYRFSTFGGANACEAMRLNGRPPVSADRKYTDNVVRTLNNRDNAFARARVHDLFAKFYAVASSTGAFERVTSTTRLGPRFDQRSNYKPLLDVSTSTIDRSGPGAGQVGANLIPPQVYSVNPANCQGTTRFGVNEGCGVGEVNNVTVNNRNGTLKNYDRDSQGLRDEDVDNDGYVDPLISNIQFAATMQFYFFADDNRMPVRRVLIDWGDGTQIVNQGKTGLYKNQKPYCSISDKADDPDLGVCGNTGVTCKADKDCPIPDTGGPITCNLGTGAAQRFGNARRACTAQPEIVTHDYTCTLQDVRPTPKAYTQLVSAIQNPQAVAILRNQYGLTAANDRVCVFKPRVQVMDNWEWCTGINPTTGQNQGLWNGSALRRCDSDSAAWIPYRGEIYVVPPTSS